MNTINVNNTMNINDTGVYDSVIVQDQIIVFRPPSPSLEQALITYVPNPTFNTVQQQRRRNSRENVNLLNTFSRVSIAVGKYPSDAILRDYSGLQMWMYIHANKWAPVDICQSLARLLLLRPDDYDDQTLFNVRLICAEAYQTTGNTDQAYCEYDEVKTIASGLDDTRRILNLHEIDERDRKRKKIDEIGMKLKFQSEFQSNFIEGQTHQRSHLTQNDFLEQLDMDNISPEQCRFIWRQVVLQSTFNPKIAIPSAEWLLSYASRFQSNTLSHANSLYVALNLFLFGYGSRIFHERSDIDVFKMLDTIAQYFEQNGNQSKQFSSVHKMAHVWGTAAVAFHLASEEYKYFVCASMIRVSFESLGICFLSSGIESLYILARKHTPDFFKMMAYDPNIKLISPACINHFRRKLDHHVTSIPYSSEIVDQFVFEVFNIDVSDHRL